MKNFKLINKAGCLTTGDEFKVLYFICNTLNMQKTTEIELDRVILAKLCGWWKEDRPKYAMNKVSAITSSLVEKGLLKKRLTFNKTSLERKAFYSIPTLEDEKLLQKTRASNSNEYHEIKLNKNEHDEITSNTTEKHEQLQSSEDNFKNKFNDGLPF